MTVLEFDPTSDAVIDDPYELYRQLREQRPVHRSAQGDWVVARHADVVACLHDERLSRLPPGAVPFAPPGSDPAVAAAFRMFMSLDPPDHTRLRRLFSDAFRPSALARLQASIDAISSTLVAEAVGAGDIEYVSSIALTLPSIVIGDLLGVAEDDRAPIIDLARRFSDFDPDLRELTEEQTEEVVGVFHGIARFAHEMVTTRRDDTPSDVLRAIYAALDSGAATLDEVVATFALLFMAGHDTTISLLANGTLALARHPGQWDLLRHDPSLATIAVEELLRFDSPVQVATRFAQQEITLGDTRIAPGERLVLLLASANRDPAVFPDPDVLDLRRRPTRHVAFGHGIHFCLGAPLARMEAVSLFRTLAASDTGLELTAPPEWRRTLGARSLDRLAVRLT